jgi:uncharacterized protein
VESRERIVVLDVLRGLALCGVLIGNLHWIFSGRLWSPDPAPGALDGAAHWFVLVVVQSKAQTLLTFLFGLGFAVQLLRAEDRGEPVTGLYVRRLVALFVIGALHVFVLWWGDVTWTYAVAGFGLLLFRRASDRVRIASAIILIFVPYLLWHIPSLRQPTIHLFLDMSEMKHYTEQLVAAMHGPSFTAVMWAHLQFALAFQAPIYSWYYSWLVGRFLIGYIAGTQRWFANDGADHLALFRKMLGYGLVAGAAATTTAIIDVVALDDYELTLPAQLALAAVHELGYLGLAAAYMAIVVLLIQRPRWRRALQIIAPAGRMPLTTYIAQSVICTALFYGWGLGWAGHVGDAGCLALAVAIFVLEVAACHLWLRRFRFGPLEWIWRTMVYLRPQPMRLTTPEPATTAVTT